MEFFYPILKAFLCVVIGFLVGDFLSTFVWHVPMHVFGKLHLSTHHKPNQTFAHYAIWVRQHDVLLDGLLGIFPHVLLMPIVWQISIPGAIIPWFIGFVHVSWRHSSALGWKTPALVQKVCNAFCIVTPEFHWEHHRNPNANFGDFFTFYDPPARLWLQILRSWKLRRINARRA